MQFIDATISPQSLAFFQENKEQIATVATANSFLAAVCGIQFFFNHTPALETFQQYLEQQQNIINEPDRRAYGDFQTNAILAKKVVTHIAENQVETEQAITFLLEPTCGKGSFIIAALQHLPQLKNVVGIEIYAPYVWATKFAILDLFLQEKAICKPEIHLLHEDIFQFDLAKLAKKNTDSNVLIIGNPPWVTNAELGTLEVKNLPKKSNFKQLKGLDAITGKGNFDIAEYISLQLLQHFHQHEGQFAFLIKNAVVKSLVVVQKKVQYRLGNMHQLNIDAKKEFNVSVDACLFQSTFNQTPEYACQALNFYTQEPITRFGWQNDKFVYAMEAYQQTADIEGISPFVWRQGMKHDCSKIMELNRLNGHYINGLKAEVSPEKDLLYGLLKSSDLKQEMVGNYRKTTIVTQKKIGQETSYIQRDYPKTYAYLDENRAYFERRKSSIYKGKPPFSIFGIGDYSFAKYKVAVSGMYKRTTFSLVLPENEKPLMLDDTCYFIGFDNLEDAQIAQKILNSPLVQNFLKALIFPDAKRPITKSVLMRIDLAKAYALLTPQYEDENWYSFGKLFEANEVGQMSLF